MPTMTRALLIACGNPLRGDDGVAAHTLALLPGDATARRLQVHQLTPELASDLARHEIVLFVDADRTAHSVRILPVGEDAPSPSALTHASTVQEVVMLARALFAWRGAAFTCALPIDGVDAGAPLSARARRSARIGARALRRFLRRCA